jgi:hypothetical protein
MAMSKIFTSKQSIFTLLALTVVGSIIFLIIQNQIIDIESESIKLEFEVKKQTERMLFDLKEILASNTEKDYKTTESLALINNIRTLLDKDYVFLRVEAQQNVNIINNRLDDIEKEVVEGNFEEALELTEELIEDLEESDDLGTIGNNSGGGSGNNSGNSPNNDPDYSEDDEENEGASNPSDNSGDNGTNGDDQGDDSSEEGTEEETTTEENPTLKKGTTPSFDRNRNADNENSNEEVIELKIGE